MQRIILLLAALFFGLLAIYWIGSPSEPVEPQQSSSAPTTQPENTTPAVAVTTDSPTRQTLQLENLNIPLDDQGLPLASPSVKQLFDTIALTKQGQSADEWKLSALQPYQQQLSEQGLARLQTLLNHYVEYQLALQLFQMEDTPSLNAALNQIQSLRQEYLSGVQANPLFSDWQQLEDFALSTVEIIQNATNVGAAQNQLQKQAQALPASVQQAGKDLAARSLPLLAMVSEGQSGEQIKVAAEQLAAASLIQPGFEFDEPNEDFMEAYFDYGEAKSQLNDTSEANLTALRQQFFSGTDQFRAKTLDRMEQM